MPTPTLSLTDFIARWQSSTLTERAAAQSHFTDLCHTLGYPSPTEADPTGESYAFERGAAKSTGGDGWADVWMRDRFSIEYKGKKKNLAAAYQQLLQYRESLDNPPLLVVTDMVRFEVHTNFTATSKQVYAFTLADLASTKPLPGTTLTALDVLRAMFDDPDRLRPNRTSAQVTEAAATEFARIADGLRTRGVDAHRAARFLMRLLFCLFAEDTGLLPAEMFTHLVERTRNRPTVFAQRINALFSEMAGGGWYGVEEISYFNGGLFAGDDLVVELQSSDMDALARAAKLDWSSIEPAIFGTLFERSLDPDKRSQLGAHYTSVDDIMLVVEPVLMRPLRRRWAAVQNEAAGVIQQRSATSGNARSKFDTGLRKLLTDFTAEIAATRVLDPACGSGNFLYVALKELLNLEKEVSQFAASSGLSGMFPEVSPAQLYGIEINTYAHELASVVVWIGYIQWLRENGFGTPSTPILRPLNNIAQMDAILADDGGEPIWPEAEVIIGNPPFLGGNKIRQGMGDEYVDKLFHLYEGRVPAFADLVCYWFEQARAQLEQGKVNRVGLLATQGIRGGANRRVLERIKESGDIFMAWSDRAWVLDGANVRVSIVGFDSGTEQERELNGQGVTSINADLTANTDLTNAVQLQENKGICFMGPSPKAPFDIAADVAKKMLTAPLNINGRPNRDVVRPVASAVDLVQQSRGEWTIDFGLLSLNEAAKYEQPFEYVKQHVYPVRSQNRRAAYAEKWWQYAEARPGMRKALQGKSRYIATPGVSKHRIFVWVEPQVLCNQGTLVFARDDDYFFGVLQSRIHELWALRQGTALEDRPRYTPTTTFETFPFPYPPDKEPLDSTKVAAIANAARKLVTMRDRWLKPVGADAAELKKRTLTKLYNERPTWLRQAHQRLDEAVLEAYGWPTNISDEEILARLLALNLERSKGNALQPDQAEAANPLPEDIPPDEWISDLPSIASDNVQAGITAIVRSYPEYMVEKVSRQGQPLSLALYRLLDLPRTVANQMWQRQLHSWLQGIRFISWLQEKSYTQKQILALVDENGTELRGLAEQFCKEVGYGNAEAFARKVGSWLKQSGSAALTDWLTGGNWYSRLDQYLNTRYHGVFLMDKSAQLAELYRLHGETIRSIASDTFVLYDGEGALAHGTNGFDVRNQLLNLQIPANQLPALLIWPQLLNAGILITIAPLLDAVTLIPTTSNLAADEDRYALLLKLLKEMVTMMEAGSDLPMLKAGIEHWIADQIPAGGIVVTLYTALGGGVTCLSSPEGVQVNIGVTQYGDSFVGNQNVSTGSGDISNHQ